MLQQVLAQDSWQNRLTKEDWRALTPLFYLHINPYGEFSLDMTTRLGIEDTVTVNCPWCYECWFWAYRVEIFFLDKTISAFFRSFFSF